MSSCRFRFGVRPTSNLAMTDNLSGEEGLITALDKASSLPGPHLGWDFQPFSGNLARAIFSLGIPK